VQKAVKIEKKNNISKSAKKEMAMAAHFPQMLIIYLPNRLSVDRNEQ